MSDARAPATAPVARPGSIGAIATRDALAEPAARRALVVLLMASSLTVLAGAIIAPALPGLALHFRGQVADPDLWKGLVLTLPGLAIVLTATLAGWWSDRVGRWPPMLVGLVLYALSGTVGLWTNSPWLLLASRGVLGVGVAFVMTSATAQIGDRFPGPERARVLGWQSSAMAGGGVVFLILGGFLGAWSWRAPFAVYGFAFVVLGLGWWWLRPPADDRHPPGPTAVAAECAADAASAGSDGGAFADAATRAPAPAIAPAAATVPVPLRALVPILIGAFVGMLSFYIIPLYVPDLVRQRLGWGPAGAGMAIALVNGMAAIVAMNYRRIAGIGPWRSLALVATGIGGGLALLAVANTAAGIVVALTITGLGTGMQLPTLSTWLTAITVPAVRGRAVGLMTSAIFLGQFATPLAAQPLVHAVGVIGMLKVVAAVLVALAGMLVILARRHAAIDPAR